MKSTSWRVKTQAVTKYHVQALNNHLPSFGIQCAHFLQMPGEIAFVDEIGDHTLNQKRSAIIHVRTRFIELLYQGFLHNQINNAQSRTEHLAKSTELKIVVVNSQTGQDW